MNITRAYSCRWIFFSDRSQHAPHTDILLWRQSELRQLRFYVESPSRVVEWRIELQPNILGTTTGTVRC